MERSIESIRLRLEKKSIAELKAIYVRIHGMDLLRGSKSNMVSVLCDTLTIKYRWYVIATSDNVLSYQEWNKVKHKLKLTI